MTDTSSEKSSGRIFAFINGQFAGDLVVVALAEDGTALGSHISSSVSWAQHDIGVVGDWKHDRYAKHYSDGFTVEWVEDPDAHEDLQRAVALNKAQAHEDKTS